MLKNWDCEIPLSDLVIQCTDSMSGHGVPNLQCSARILSLEYLYWIDMGWVVNVYGNIVYKNLTIHTNTFKILHITLQLKEES